MPFRKFFTGFYIFLFLVQIFAAKAQGVVSSCSASISTHEVYISSENQLDFVLNNTSSGSIRWVKIISPSADFEITDASDSESNWSNIIDSTSVIFHGYVLPDSWSNTFRVVINTSANTSSGSWIVQASDSDEGSDPTVCSGDLSTTISSSVPDLTPPTVGAVTISDVSTSSVKISWTTNESATSELNFGLSDAYGTVVSNSTSQTSHSFTLTGLSVNTSYHYSLKNTDSSGNVVETDDGTFTTASSATTITTTTTVTTTVERLITPTPTPTPTPDRTPPAVLLSSAINSSKPFKKAPVISGSASDNKDVFRVDYSTDDGKNWLPVEKVKNIRGQIVTFEFTPNIAEDGNYKVKVRARDSMGNTGVSRGVVLVIDRLPPEVGGNLFSVGPQILVPDKNGLIFGLAGISQKITLSAVGGPISIEIDTDQKGKSFNMTKNSDNGLWSSVLNFESPGVYSLTAKSMDGAENRTERQINKIVVEESGKVVDPRGQPIKDAQISIYHFDSLTQRFFLWDGKSYGQNNPQKTNKEGKYVLFIPPGKYYMYIKAGGFKPVRTDIFTINETFPINAKFVLNYQEYIGFGIFRLPFYSFKQDTVKFKPTSPEIPKEVLIRDELSGEDFPSVTLIFGEKDFPTSNLKGKDTVLTFFNTWSPLSSEQLGILDKASSSQDFKIYAVASQETGSKVSIFKRRGGYRIDFLADPDGLLVRKLDLKSLPISVFLNKKGKIVRIKSGILGMDDLR